MRMRALLLLLLASTAHAAPAIAVGAGIGITDQIEYGAYHKEGTGEASAQLRIGYRPDDRIAIVLYADITESIRFDIKSGDDVSSREWRYIIAPGDLGVSAQLEYGRLWIAPWLGVNVARTHRTFTQTRCTVQPYCTTEPSTVDEAWDKNFAYGVVGGVDVFQHHAERVGMFIGLQSHSVPDDPQPPASPGYISLTLGVGYRR